MQLHALEWMISGTKSTAMLLQGRQAVDNGGGVCAVDSSCPSQCELVSDSDVILEEVSEGATQLRTRGVNVGLWEITTATVR